MLVRDHSLFEVDIVYFYYKIIKDQCGDIIYKDDHLTEKTDKEWHIAAREEIVRENIINRYSSMQSYDIKKIIKHKISSITVTHRV